MKYLERGGVGSEVGRSYRNHFILALYYIALTISGRNLVFPHKPKISFFYEISLRLSCGYLVVFVACVCGEEVVKW